MLLYSRRKGKHATNHMQFDTIRSFWTVYGNFIRASPQAVIDHLALGDNAGRYLRFNRDECGSLWFSRFIEGLKNRMGQTWVPNKAFDTRMLLQVLNVCETKIRDSFNNWRERHKWIVFCAYATIVYVISSRGPEGLLIDLEGLNKHWTPKNEEYLIIALLGRVKGKSFDQSHLLPSVQLTTLGVKVG